MLPLTFLLTLGGTVANSRQLTDIFLQKKENKYYVVVGFKFIKSSLNINQVQLHMN